jgi:hypothetical protein
MISTDYYTRLEQGRLTGASTSVLDAIADALNLGDDQRSYLYKLTNKKVTPRTTPRSTFDLRHSWCSTARRATAVRIACTAY